LKNSHRHDPIFDAAREGPIHWIDHDDHEKVDMKDKDRDQSEADVTHLDDRVVAMEPDEGTGSVEEEGIDDSEHDLRDAKAIEVHTGRPIVASRIEVDHLC